MGGFTVSKRIVRQGHTLAVNITNECKLYGYNAGDIITVSVDLKDEDTDAVKDND